MQKINIENGFSQGVIMEIKGALYSLKSHLQPRMIRVPVEEFTKAVNLILKDSFMPFQPMVMGFACEPSPISHPVIVCVADDDTNLHKTFLTESEAL